MNDEICVLETCNPENVDDEVSETKVQTYSTESDANVHGSDVAESMEDAHGCVCIIDGVELEANNSVDNETGESVDSIKDSVSEMNDSSVASESQMPVSTQALVVVDNGSDSLKEEALSGPAADINASFKSNDDELITRLEGSENRCAELETRLFMFEEKFTELQKKMTDALDSSGNQLSVIQTDLHSKAHESDFKQLRQDFDHFSKRLKRVAQAEDSVNAETLDPTKVPPDVLEITYAKTLNDLYSAMLGIYGDRESVDMVEAARDHVREFSAGVDFFRFEDESFIVRGLSEAISSKIVSVKQIHGTYVELFKMLFQYVPNYNSQDFRSFVETGSREYTIEKVVSHERHLEQVVSNLNEHKDELGNLTENMTFMAELQNNQLEETASNTQQLEDIKEQMKSIAKAVNLHTKAISKLNRTLTELKDLDSTSSTVAIDQKLVTQSSIPGTEGIEIQDISKLEEMVTSKASREEIMAITGEIESFKAEVGGMFNSLQEQLHTHIPGYEESACNDHLDIDTQENESFFPESAEESSLQSESSEITSEPMNFEEFAPDQENLFDESENIPVDLESVESVETVESVAEEVPLDLGSADISSENDYVVPVSVEESQAQAEVSETTPEPMNFEDFAPDQESLVQESENIPVDLQSVDVEPQHIDMSFMESQLSEGITTEIPEHSEPMRLRDMPIEEVILGQLSIAGSATLKQLEKQIKTNGYPIDFEKLSVVIGYLEQEQLVSTFKKGRHTFYSVAGAVNV